MALRILDHERGLWVKISVLRCLQFIYFSVSKVLLDSMTALQECSLHINIFSFHLGARPVYFLTWEWRVDTVKVKQSLKRLVLQELIIRIELSVKVNTTLATFKFQ